MKYLIAGLGNPGSEYADTRHNAGFMVADRVAADKNAKFINDKHAWYTEFSHKGRIIHLIKPTTFMNLSGKAVNHWLQLLKIPTENLLVIADEIALPFGKLRLKPKGGDAGHNGLKSIQALLGTNEYARLRFGVGNDFGPGQQADYVLSAFSHEEQKEVPFLVNDAAEIALSFVSIGTELTMTRFNK